MDVNDSLLELGKLTATVTIVWQLLRRTMSKVDRLTSKVDILAEKAKDVSLDHDKVVVLGVKVDELSKDLNAAHIKIRDIEKEP